MTGPFAAALAGEPDNLVLRAARALATEAGVSHGAHIVLDKRLPVASGVGGGSADAAATLRLLCRLWGIAPAPEVLGRLATGLGADVPVCLAGQTVRMGGIGERLEPAPVLPACGILLVNPGVAVATAEVFRARRGAWSLAGRVAGRLARRGGHGRRPGQAAQRPRAGGHGAVPGDRRRARGTERRRRAADWRA